MKAYPSIQYWNKGIYGDRVWVFEKLDGTQIRAEWSKKRGFYKFGSRGQMIDENHPQWGEAVTIFQNNFSDSLPAAIKKNFDSVENFTCFAEYYGYNSFAGNHEPSDKKNVKLFDISLYKKGFITPKEFAKLDISYTAKSLGCHTYTKELVQLVQNAPWSEDLILNSRSVPRIQNVFEGVVCKGTRKTKGQDLVWQVKVKTNEWLTKVKAQYGEDYLLSELNGDKSLLV